MTSRNGFSAMTLQIDSNGSMGSYENTEFTNGSSTQEHGDKIEISSSSSLNGETNGRNLQSMPKESTPPPLPKNPPRSFNAVPLRRKPSKSTDNRPATKFIPESEITIPSNGNLQEFSIDDMATFFRHLGFEERTINHLYRKNVDGKRFAQISDSNLEILDMKNPIVVHFRDRTMPSSKGKIKKPFQL